MGELLWAISVKWLGLSPLWTRMERDKVEAANTVKVFKSFSV